MNINAADRLRYLKNLVQLLVQKDPKEQLHTFLRLDGIQRRNGAAAIVQAMVDRVYSFPVFQALYDQGFVPGGVDVEQLLLLKEGTLGHEFGKLVRKHDLNTDYYESVAPRDRLEYFTLRKKQTHDILHLLLGYPPFDPVGEMGINGFSLAQSHGALLYAGIPAMTMLLLISFKPALVLACVDAFCEGYQRGKRAQFAIGMDLENHWEMDLEQVRQKFRLV